MAETKARTAEEIQKEIAGMQQFLNMPSQMVGGAMRSGSSYLNPKWDALQKELAALKQTPEYTKAHTVEGVSQTAMEETQRRAAEDREAALAEMRAGKEEALGEDYGAWKGAVSDLPSKQLGEDYTDWKTAVDEMGTGEYGEDIKEQMLAKSVIPV